MGLFCIWHCFLTLTAYLIAYKQASKETSIFTEKYMNVRLAASTLLVRPAKYSIPIRRAVACLSVSIQITMSDRSRMCWCACVAFDLLQMEECERNVVALCSRGWRVEEQRIPEYYILNVPDW